MSPVARSDPAAGPPSGEADAPTASTDGFQRILVALDASDHANRALGEAARLAASAGGVVTGIHVYAATLHDRRFRQMESGLPERYQDGGEIERQREIHDDLISRGLNIISDSYHDMAAPACGVLGVPYRRLSPEGKNYRRIVEAAGSGDYDLLALGAVGLGAVPGSTVGTVCERVARRSPIDVLVIRDPGRPLGDGPLVVGLDGSARSFGVLTTALEIARRLDAPVHAVAAYDRSFHYIAFHKLSGMLSEEAGRAFRFKDQEKLHEEIIDSGMAKIYRSHLEVGRSLASEAGMGLTVELLDGKPHRAIAAYAERVGASLLLVGKTGIHADAELDIGGNTETLLRGASCHVWLGVRDVVPPLEVLARETIAWADDAERKMARVPQAAKKMVRMAILRFVQERGHTVVTAALIDQATSLFCPARGGMVDGESVPTWSSEAQRLVDGVGDAVIADNLRRRAEELARGQGASSVLPEHVHPLSDTRPESALRWSAAALARRARVPGMVREAFRLRAEAMARERGVAEVAVEIADAAIRESRAVMRQAMESGGHRSAASGPPAGDDGRD